MRKLLGLLFVGCGLLAPNCGLLAQTAPPDCAQISALLEKTPESVSIVDRYICTIVDNVKERKQGNPADNIPAQPKKGMILADDSIALFVILIAKSLTPNYLVEAEEARLDKQVGGSDANAGSTSLVSKGSVPAVLGFAVENGALAQTASGTTITFRGNPVGIAEALRKQGFSASFQDDRPETRFLRKISFAVSFDTDRGSMPGTFTGDRQQLSSYSLRYEILNRRDPRHSSYASDWETFLNKVHQPFMLQWDSTARALRDSAGWKDPVLQAWFADTQQALENAAPDQVEQIFKDHLAKLDIDRLWESTKEELKKFEKKIFDLLDGRKDLLAKISKGMIATFDYTNSRVIDGPDLSNFKFIAEGALWGGSVDLTANVSVTIMNSVPSGSNLMRVRDFQVSTQMDIPIGPIGRIGNMVVSLSGKYERMRDDAMMAGMMVPDTKGDIGLGQIKLTIPVKGSGVKIPISLTFANRTELIKEKEVRGNFGLTFDLDSIFARLKP